jgi:cyclopropane-fatty-acyl-phospholipid synthase
MFDALLARPSFGVLANRPAAALLAPASLVVLAYARPGMFNQIGIFFTYRVLKLSIYLFEKNLVPDWITRWGMRRLLETNLVPKDVEEQRASLMSYYESLRSKPIAMNTAEANEQHYELPPEFFFPIMGARLKYSCCIFNKGTHNDDLNKAEEDALKQVKERAQLADGMDILELGCGWGSLSLYMAEQFPKSRITSVSNSIPQRLEIEKRAKERGLKNLTVLFVDV